VPINRARIAAEAFVLYAETYLPDAASQTATLDALALCAEGTARATPSVAVYAFRRSPLAQLIGDDLFPGSLALESTEIYLTRQGFRGHIETPEFRSGLRAMYKGTRRLGARIFWIGVRPESDMLHNIIRSDPEARPIAPVRASLFDAEVHAAARARDVAILSIGVTVEPGGGARAIDAVDAVADALRTISFVAFFHPLRPALLRLTIVLPIDADQPAGTVAGALAPLVDVGALLGHGQVSQGRAPLAADLAAALASTGTWTVVSEGYAGYPLHPAVSTAPDA
jgi:hypothetical protein